MCVYTCPCPLLFVCACVLCGPRTVVASPIAEHRLRTHRLSGHGSRAQPLRGMWDLPGPGHEPASPASAGGLSTTAPPGKPQKSLFIHLGKVLEAFHSLSLTVLSSIDVSCVLPQYKSSPCNFLSDTSSPQHRELKVIFQDSALIIPKRCLPTPAMARKADYNTHPLDSYSTCYIIIL